MLLIFCTSDRLAILSKIGVVVSNYPDTQIEFVQEPGELQLKLPSAKAVFCMGSTSLSMLQAQGWAPKNRKVTGLRKQILYIESTPLMVSYSPSIGDIDYGQFVDLLTDTGLALRLATTGTTAPKYGDYHYHPDLKQIVAGVRELVDAGQRVDLAFDTETLGLDRFHPDGYIVGLQFSWKTGTGHMVAFSSKTQAMEFLLNIENQNDLYWLLNCQNISLRAANGKYDIEWVYEQTGITCTNFKFDTTLVGSLLDENRSNGLDVHVKIYAPALGGYSDQFDLKANKARMDLEYAKDPEGFLNYSAGDADGTLRVAETQRTILLKDEKLTSFYVNILHPAARAFELVERGGVFVDKQAFDELEADLITDLNRLIVKGKSIIGGILSAKHYDADKNGGINLTKASLINDFMFSPAGLNLKPKMLTEKTKAPVTSMEHLELFADNPEAKEFVDTMREFSSTNKTLGTYIVGFRKHIRSDGKMHPSYFLHAGNKDEGEGGTNTGRLSVKDPAFQTIPKHTTWGKRIRRCYSAPPGMVVLESDYSQGELRVIACLAHESNMIEAYRKGLDLHVLTGGSASGYTYEQMLEMKKTDKEKFDSLRQLAKAMNFGLIYGMGVDGFMEYSRLGYKVVLTSAEAEKSRTGFFNTYPRLVEYHQVYKKFAHNNGYVCSPLGRLRHLPLINSQRQDVRAQEERRAINSPVQGCLSDMMIWAIAEQAGMGWFDDTPCFGAIHDAGYYYLPEDNAEFYAKRIVQVMENLPFHKVGWTPQLKFTADAKIGKNMADLKEIKFS